MATNEDCTRVGPSSKCFCGHLFKSHAETRSLMRGECGGGKDGPCKCKRFQFIPRRPEEVGEWWLPRRKVKDSYTTPSANHMQNFTLVQCHKGY